MKFGLLLAMVVVLVGGFAFRDELSGLVVTGKHSENSGTIKSGQAVREATPSSRITVSAKWDLPAVLKEISGIAHMGGNRFACIQDEEGTIFIFNTATRRLEQQIPFAAPGDFEDIALVGNTAWVARADGKLFSVDMNGGKETAKEYNTHLTVKHNVEGLCYDPKANRLLVAIKDGEPGNKDYKGIYAFDLAAKKLAKEPVYRIDLKHKLFKTEKGGKKAHPVKPSAIGIHPRTNELYVVDGPKARLLVMDKAGNIQSLLSLGKTFEQPEGIAFGPGGELYISNEGNKQPGNILQVRLD